MILSERINYEDIKKQLSKDDRIAIITCNTCTRISGSADRGKMRDLAFKLRGDGYSVVEGFLLTMVCMEPYLEAADLSDRVDTLLVLACSAGSSCVKRNFPNFKVVEGLNTKGLMVSSMEEGVMKLMIPFEAYETQRGDEFRLSEGSPTQKKELDMEVEE